MSHAHLLAKAAALFERPDWRAAAERLLHWCLGHNTLNCSLFTGIGYRQPVGYSYRIPQLPEAMVNGFIGRPDDTPYLEESTAIEWNKLFAFRNSRSISDESALAIPQPAFTENAVLCLR